ncbi:MAG: hypothetical protein GOMPHAMPRED_003810 [Gomphillus americanus]|uniref:Uncharacterized protein n=1 Tax=Gomphillus americanus TaxID=1940652 RepID=A0A8H3FLM2_9LECA|nr:MAG: hypothetical protein GOMPHAMPRED_003810 [Gomphillus americanus]
MASGNCPGLRIKPTGAAGYLNPLSLPPNFPGTAALSNYPSSVTSITQYLGYTGTALVQSWTENYVQTYALASGGDIGVAAISTGLATSIAMSTTTLITPTGQNPPNRVSVGVWPDLPSGISPSSSPSLSTSRTTTPTTTAAASTIAVPTHAPKSSSNRLSVNARVLIVLLMSGMALV